MGFSAKSFTRLLSPFLDWSKCPFTLGRWLWPWPRLILVLETSTKAFQPQFGTSTPKVGGIQHVLAVQILCLKKFGLLLGSIQRNFKDCSQSPPILCLRPCMCIDLSQEQSQISLYGGCGHLQAQVEASQSFEIDWLPQPQRRRRRKPRPPFWNKEPCPSHSVCGTLAISCCSIHKLREKLCCRCKICRHTVGIQLQSIGQWQDQWTHLMPPIWGLPMLQIKDAQTSHQLIPLQVNLQTLHHWRNHHSHFAHGQTNFTNSSCGAEVMNFVSIVDPGASVKLRYRLGEAAAIQSDMIYIY